MAGQELTSPSVPLAFKKNSGGLNSTASPLSLANNESSDLQNIDFDKFGSILKRNGYTALNTSAFNSGATWVGLHWFELSDTTTTYLMGVCGNKIAKMDTLDGTWDDITGGLTITAGDDNFVSSVTYRDRVNATNGVDAPFKWTGTGNCSAWTTVTGLDWAKYTELFENYMFLGHVSVSATEHRSRVYWSTVGDPDTWSATDFNDVNRDDGQVVTGLKAMGEELIIFKSHSIHKALFTGDADVPFVFNKTRSHVGCIAGHSIQNVDNGLVFLAQDGYYFFDGNNSFKLSDRVTATLDTFAPARREDTTSIYLASKNRYYSSASISGGTTHSRVMTWDSFNNAWSIYTGMNPNVWAIVNTAGEQRVYFGDYSGFVYQADTGADDYPLNVQTAINAYYYTKWFDYDDIVNQKGTDHIYAYYQLAEASVTFAYSYDFESADSYSQTFNTSAGGATYGSANYDTSTYASVGGAVQRLDLDSRGRVIRFKFANNTLAETMQIDGIGALPHLETHV